MRKISIILFLVIVVCFSFSCGDTNSEDSFWGHRIYLSNDISYGEHEQQRLDIYMQGSWIGEPSYFEQAPVKCPTLICIHGGGWVGGNKESVTQTIRR